MTSETTPEHIIEIQTDKNQSYWVQIDCCQGDDDCGADDCESREILIQCAREGKTALVEWQADESQAMGYEVTADRLCAALDVDTGEVEWDYFPSGRGVLEEFPWCREFFASLDGEALEAIARTRTQILGLPDGMAAWDEQCLWQADPGYHFCSNEIFDLNREDMYLVDDCVYDSYEDYCVNPDCDCGEVKVLFAVNEGEIDVPWVGFVVISKDGSLAFTKEDCPLELLECLWAKYVARFPHYRDRHAKVYPRMKDFGASLKAFREKRKWEKVGPNQPCPCGTGKKFKKCCFLKERR